MSTTETIAQTIIDQITDASAEVIEAIKQADISDDAKLAMLYFADPEFREVIQHHTAEMLVERYDSIELAGPVERLRSNFLHGIKRLPVVLR